MLTSGWDTVLTAAGALVVACVGAAAAAAPRTMDDSRVLVAAVRGHVSEGSLEDRVLISEKVEDIPEATVAAGGAAAAAGVVATDTAAVDDTAGGTGAAALAGLLAAGAAHAMVSMTVWVTVEARAVIVVVGAAPLA